MRMWTCRGNRSLATADNRDPCWAIDGAMRSEVAAGSGGAGGSLVSFSPSFPLSKDDREIGSGNEGPTGATLGTSGSKLANSVVGGSQRGWVSAWCTSERAILYRPGCAGPTSAEGGLVRTWWYAASKAGCVFITSEGRAALGIGGVLGGLDGRCQAGWDASEDSLYERGVR